MKIKNIEGLTAQELASGGKFVIYLYTISIIVMTFKNSSDVYFVRPDEQAWVKGLPYTLLTVLLGWWGIPWGPIYSISEQVKRI